MRFIFIQLCLHLTYFVWEQVFALWCNLQLNLQKTTYNSIPYNSSSNLSSVTRLSLSWRDSLGCCLYRVLTCFQALCGIIPHLQSALEIILAKNFPAIAVPRVQVFKWHFYLGIHFRLSLNEWWSVVFFCSRIDRTKINRNFPEKKKSGSNFQ